MTWLWLLQVFLYDFFICELGLDRRETSYVSLVIPAE